jgi:hypothetical protein
MSTKECTQRFYHEAWCINIKRNNYEQYHGKVDDSTVVIEITLMIVWASPSLACYEWN